MDQPNLLILMVDQMEAALLDPDHGLPIPLPHLERLREQSTRFSRAYCPAPICTPTRASFQLGQAVHRHGVIGNDRGMPSETPTLPERLLAVGYRTAYAGKWHLDKGNARGWSRFDEVMPDFQDDTGFVVMKSSGAPHEGVAPYPTDRHIDGRVAAAGRRYRDELRKGGQPWALMVSFFGPHAPYYVPAEWHGRLDPAEIPLPADFDAPFEGKPTIQSGFRCRAWGETWSEDKWRRVRAAYFAYCMMLDHLIGSLLDGIDNKTAVLFLSDHGEMNGHFRMIYKGPMMYESLVRIPVLLREPGQHHGTVDSRLVQTQDLTATLLKLAGARLDERIDGHHLLHAEEAVRDYVVSEFYEANWVNPPVHQRVAMILDHRWKYAVTEGHGEELYDLTEPLPEARNLAGSAEHGSREQSMRAMLGREIGWVKATAYPKTRESE